MPVQSAEIAYEPTSQQQPRQQQPEGKGNEVSGAKDPSIDGGGLRSPLEDADIFNTLFTKWGSDDATEVRRDSCVHRQSSIRSSAGTHTTWVPPAAVWCCCWVVAFSDRGTPAKNTAALHHVCLCRLRL